MNQVHQGKTYKIFGYCIRDAIGYRVDSFALNINVLLIFSNYSESTSGWRKFDNAGAITIVLSLFLRRKKACHWIMWELGNLFENRCVQGGINSISVEQTVIDTPDAIELGVSAGEIEVGVLVFRQNQPNRDNNRISKINLFIEGGEKVGIVGQVVPENHLW